MRRLPLFDLQDVVAVLTLHDLRIADLLAEKSLLELRHRGAALEEAQFAARVLAGILGVFPGEVGKVRTALNLFEQRLGLGLGGGVGFGVGACGYLDENVARAGLLRRRILVLVLGEVLLNLLLAGLRRPAGQLIGTHGKVGDPALLRHGRGIARGVLLEEGFEVAVQGVDGLAHIVG